MQKIEKFDEIKVTENKPTLQVGGYECVIKNVKHFEHNSIKKISLEIDIASGEFKDYYQQKYDERDANSKFWDDGSTISFPEELKEDKEKSYFKGLITAIQSYNPNYTWNWDEETLKGLKINCNYSLKEYKGSDGNIYTKPQISRFVNSKDNFKKDYVPTVRTINNEFIKYEDYKNNKNSSLSPFESSVEITDDMLAF